MLRPILASGLSLALLFISTSARADCTPAMPSAVIMTICDLQNIGYNQTSLAGTYFLGKDIDASDTVNWNNGAGFTPIGNASTTFSGVLDGQGHIITGLTIKLSTSTDVGLIGWNTGHINNVGLVAATVTGYQVVGALTGQNDGDIDGSFAIGNISGSDYVGVLAGGNGAGSYWYQGHITNSSSGGSVSGNTFIGGLAGFSDYSAYGEDISIVNSYSSATVMGHDHIGGLVGSLASSNVNISITGSYATGDVTGNAGSYYVGGLVGSEGYLAVITDCYATGNVSGGSEVGGLVGFNSEGQASINQSFATGSVNGGSDVGGLIGSGGVVVGSYALGTVTGSSNVGGLIGITGGLNIIQDYAAGRVVGSADVGGLIGHNTKNWNNIQASYWDTQSSGQTSSDGGTGLTTAQLQSGTLPNGFDPTIWIDMPGQYPELQWQLEGPLFVLDPFLLNAPDLSNINLATIIPSLGDFSATTAAGLIADNSATAIALFQTGIQSNSVTFSVNNGASLAPYSNSFLQNPLAAGVQTLTVSPNAFVQVGSVYYAPVLVQAPAVGVGVILPGSITVTATQGAQTQTATLSLIPPPVVLVHGLWGCGTISPDCPVPSLASTQAYLQKTLPWSLHPELVQLIDYTTYDQALGYSSTFDPFDAPNPAATFLLASDGLYSTLDSAHIVGRRVDVVAHSMGGLVARHIASLPNYHRLRNRNQGEIHEIVTLDTPELGSALAPWLMRYGSDFPSGYGVSRAIYEAICPFKTGLLFGVTLGDCMAALSEPLAHGRFMGAPPGGISSAVSSLDPLGSNIKNLPTPNFTIWRAMSAAAPGDSALRVLTNSFIAAMTQWFLGPPAQTVDQILANYQTDIGSQTNDATVTLDSQTAGAVQGQYGLLISNLSHTTIPSWVVPILQVFFTGFTLENFSVTDDDRIHQLTGCWLLHADGSGPVTFPDGSAGGSQCLNLLTQATSVQPRIASPAPSRGVRMAKRLTLIGPNVATFTRPFEVALKVTSSELLSHWDFAREGEDFTFDLIRREGSTLHFRITPLKLGPVDLRFIGKFDDGVISTATRRVAVLPPEMPPDVFQADANFRRLRLDPRAGANVYAPHPQAVYAAAPHMKIDLRGWVRYEVASGAGDPAVVVLDDGLIQALHPGTAVVKAHFGAATDLIPVEVIDPSASSN